MTHAILVTNIKGGTGKSTIAQELSYELDSRGYDIGVLDADIDSSNLATRFGSDTKVEFEGDHMVKPVEVDGIKLYSMENAFDESSFSQSGKFQGEVVRSMIESSEFGDPDYLIVDCPPGSSDVFDQLVSVLRPNILGTISVGISDEVDDTARLVKVCNHKWVPIIGFVENMSGVNAQGEQVLTPDETEALAPFGRGDTKTFCDQIGANFLGSVPVCCHGSDIKEVASETFSNVADAIEDAEQPELPEDNIGNESFIKNVWGSISSSIKRMNEEIPVSSLQDQFGVDGREPLVMELSLTDAGPISGIFSDIIITADDGNVKVMRPGKAKRKGIKPEGGMKITSQNLRYAIEGEKKVMRSYTGEITSEPYSITDAVKMGDAELWGDKTINRLAVLDKILTDVVDESEVQKVMGASD